MSVYVPTDWSDGVTPLNAANLDHLEQGVLAAFPQTVTAPISADPTDVALPVGGSMNVMLETTGTGGKLRSVQGDQVALGARLTIRCGSTGPVVIKHNYAGDPPAGYAKFLTLGGADLTLAANSGETATFYFNGTWWIELLKNVATAAALPAMELISELDLSAVASFVAIPQNFDSLRLVWKAQLVPAVPADPIWMRCNDVATGVYDTSRIYLDNDTLLKDVRVAQAEARIGTAPGALAVAGEFARGELLFAAYRDASIKHWFGSYFGVHTRTNAGVMQGQVGGSFHSTAPITKISLVPEGASSLFAMGSAAWLYGLRGA